MISNEERSKQTAGTESSSPSGGESRTSFTKWGVVAGAIIVQMILGTVYGYSIFWQPLAAEVFPAVITEAQAAAMVAAGESTAGYRVVETEAAVARQLATQQGYLMYAFSICILSFALVMIFAGRMQDIAGPRIPALAGGALMGVGFIIAAFMQSVIVFYLAHAAFATGVALVLLLLIDFVLRATKTRDTSLGRSLPLSVAVGVVVAAVVLANEYVGALGEWDRVFLLWGTVGFLAGAGIGLAYVCPIAALVKWFPRHKGLMSGIAVAGFGFGAYFFKGDPYIFDTAWLTIPILGAQGFLEAYGIRPLFFVHGLVCLVGIGLGAMLLKNPPGPRVAATAGDSSWEETLRRPAFYLLWLMFFSGSMAGLMVIGIVQPFVTERLAAQGVDLVRAAALGTAAVGYLAVFNALGRIAWGIASDRVGRTPAFIAMFILQAIAMFLLGRVDGAVALLIAASVVGFNYGGIFALFPSVTSDLFGAKNLGVNYAMVFTSYGIAGVVGIAAGNAARVLTGSYAAAFAIAGFLCLASAGLAWALHKQNFPSAGKLRAEST